LRIKETQVRELILQGITDAEKYVEAEKLAASRDLDTWFEGIRRSPRDLEYRNKMEFSFGDAYKDGPLALGLHKKGSFYDIVTADGCRIVDADYRSILRATLDFFSERGLKHYHKKRRSGYLRHLMVRKALHTGEILVDLVTADYGEMVVFPVDGPSDEASLLSAFVNALRELSLDGEIVGILHTRNNAVADIIRDEGTTVLYGKDRFCETLLGLTFQVTPFSFFQTNSYGAEVLYDTARRYLLETAGEAGREVADAAVLTDKINDTSVIKYRTLYDLYCGTGTITQLMAPAAEKVIGVEIVEEAVEAARENAAANGIDNCRFIAGDVLKVLDTIPEKPDAIILDPPRDGVHPKALPRILSYGVRDILYISCKPKSLARDLPAILAAGYRPVRGCCVDEFPHTDNIETICLFRNTESVA
ncbi:MAG: class I SAM-dependent RNA methyltransferase, partial [Lachnospiraceae bacterium]|nr:class I SAM-dependent RNA methyltransferase [Lachnospiraceae bacterium]